MADQFPSAFGFTSRMPSTKKRSQSPVAPNTPRADTARKRRGPSLQKTGITRRDILNAALAEFLEVGIAKATMDKIAKRANLAKGTLYLHFGSKEALLEGALDATIFDSALSAIQTPRNPGESMRDYVLRLVLPSAESLQSSSRADLSRLMLSEARSYPALARLYRERVFLPWHSHFESLFQQAVDEGELRGIAPATASKLLGAPFWLMYAQETIEDAALHSGGSPAELTKAQIDAIFGVHRQSPGTPAA